MLKQESLLHGEKRGKRAPITYTHVELLSMQTSIGTWVNVALGIDVFGVLVHINLNSRPGICIIFTGLYLLLVCVVDAILWEFNAANNTENSNELRRLVLLLKFIGLALLFAFTIWAAVIMIQRVK